jgi:hypothetical protein
MFPSQIDTSVISAPQSFNAGDAATFTIFDGAYLPGDGYTSKLIFSKDGQVVLTKDGDANGTKFVFTIASADTATVVPGEYTFSFTFTKDGARSSTGADFVYINPNPEVSITLSPAQQQLAACEEAILALSSNGNASVSFNGQSFTKRNLVDLMDFRDRLQARVNAELRALGLSRKGGARTVATRFSR